MDVAQILHMRRGDGEDSYAKNSNVQKVIICREKAGIEEALEAFDFNKMCEASESFKIADMGCSSGPNALCAAKAIVDGIYRRCQGLGCPSPELLIYLNDLPGNDFNMLFQSLSSFKNLNGVGGECFIAGMPGSFYGRLFPTRTLHFVHSSSSLHWLSQVPPDLEKKAIRALNKGNIYISKTSPQSVLKAYAVQFHKDFTSFLNSRSQEIVPAGRMVISLFGRTGDDPTSPECCQQWDLLAQVFRDMIVNGLLQEGKLDSFNIPFYSPSPQELTSAVHNEGSFTLNRLEILEIDWDRVTSSETSNGSTKTILDNQSISQSTVKFVRAVMESLLESHFGREVMDPLFRRHEQIVCDHLSRNRNNKYICIILSLTKT
ncbi:PREDICTED: jasmonate O-methyltransferase-like isoform X2 [Nelumbo nucifera]|uniref:Jasmonate O-methyltransferase-like isoform X2 n=1 Tax=Nelumbo nucifera TaxID=4432 RepID=A0A1U8ADM5_NELNU|nr:PREDICTED: jasmonate O-methyltransferase-like isoform X2 [Nelumbo nucifera]